jgi:hypothetical protein
VFDFFFFRFHTIFIYSIPEAFVETGQLIFFIKTRVSTLILVALLYFQISVRKCNITRITRL